MATVSTEGDFGDSVYVLGILSQIPNGPHKLLLTKSRITKMRTDDNMTCFERLLKPLAESQPYIEECRITRPDDKIDWKSAEFRKAPYFGSTLLYAHVKHLVQTLGIGEEINGTKQWLKVNPSKETKDRIVINRTGRYRNRHFPWATIVEHYKSRLLFIGVEHEWREFIAHYGYVDFEPTQTLLDVAQLIAGSLLFIGNQSVANAIAEGLKHPMIQETSLDFPDCIFARDNVQHVYDGNCTLPAIGGMSELVYVPPPFELPHQDCSQISWFEVPPSGWRYPSIESPDDKSQDIRASTFSTLTNMVATAYGCNKAEATRKTCDHLVKLNPKFYMSPTADNFMKVKQAIANAHKV